MENKVNKLVTCIHNPESEVDFILFINLNFHLRYFLPCQNVWSLELYDIGQVLQSAIHNSYLGDRDQEMMDSVLFR
jgi:hypothetical protein